MRPWGWRGMTEAAELMRNDLALRSLVGSCWIGEMRQSGSYSASDLTLQPFYLMHPLSV